MLECFSKRTLSFLFFLSLFAGCEAAPYTDPGIQDPDTPTAAPDIDEDVAPIDDDPGWDVNGENGRSRGMGESPRRRDDERDEEEEERLRRERLESGPVDPVDPRDSLELRDPGDPVEPVDPSDPRNRDLQPGGRPGAYPSTSDSGARPLPDAPILASARGGPREESSDIALPFDGRTPRAAPSYPDGELDRDSRERIATDLRKVWDAAISYHELTGEWPDRVLRLVDARDPKSGLTLDRALEVEPHDPWGRGYRITVLDGRPVVATFGRDGEPGGNGPDADILYPVLLGK